jgi:hypothetical protein
MTQAWDALLLRLNYMVVYAPDFPAEDCTSTEREISRALAALQEFREGIERPETAGLLNLVRIEIEQARDSFATGDAKEGRRLLQSAEEHFKEALRGKQKSATFIAGPSGVLKVPE